MNKSITQFTDISPSIKGVNFEAWGGIENFLRETSNGSGASTRPQMLRRVLPWMAKANDMTALAVSELPFEIMRGSEVYDSSVDWRNKAGGIPSPQALFYNLASSLCLGRAYVIPTVISRAVVDLKYCMPHSIIPRIIDDIKWFDRTTTSGHLERYYPAGRKQEPEMLYFWLPDSDVEIGPALSYPAGVALLSADLLTSVDSTLSIYAQRGFVPATILSAKGMTGAAERERAESWWNRFLRGWEKTVAKIINADAMTINKIGAGLDELRGVYGELNKQSIENIAAAYGIPAAIFMSDMAFASEVNPLIKIWYSSSQFVKIYRTIESTFNDQLLNRFGLTLAFRPETIDAFQEDETSRAESFRVYVEAGIKRSVAAQMVGLELPTGVTYDDLDPEPVVPPPAPTNPAPAAENVQPMQNDAQPQTMDSAMRAAHNTWQRKAKNRLKETGSAVCEFVSADITEAESARIAAGLPNCRTNDDIKALFAGAEEIAPIDPLLLLAQEIKLAREALAI